MHKDLLVDVILLQEHCMVETMGSCSPLDRHCGGEVEIRCALRVPDLLTASALTPCSNLVFLLPVDLDRTRTRTVVFSVCTGHCM